jgi:hypothetical protein
VRLSFCFTKERVVAPETSSSCESDNLTNFMKLWLEFRGTSLPALCLDGTSFRVGIRPRFPGTASRCTNPLTGGQQFFRLISN